MTPENPIAEARFDEAAVASDLALLRGGGTAQADRDAAVDRLVKVHGTLDWALRRALALLDSERERGDARCETPRCTCTPNRTGKHHADCWSILWQDRDADSEAPAQSTEAELAREKSRRAEADVRLAAHGITVSRRPAHKLICQTCFQTLADPPGPDCAIPEYHTDKEDAMSAPTTDPQPEKDLPMPSGWHGDLGAFHGIRTQRKGAPLPGDAEDEAGMKNPHTADESLAVRLVAAARVPADMEEATREVTCLLSELAGMLAEEAGVLAQERGYHWPLAIEVRVGSNLDHEWPIVYEREGGTSPDPEWRRQIAEAVAAWAKGEDYTPDFARYSNLTPPEKLDPPPLEKA